MDRRDAILDATLDLIAEQGLQNAPMSQVAKRSRASAGVIYHYFESKDAIIAELYRRTKKQFAAALVQHAPHTYVDDEGALQRGEHWKRVWLNAFAFYVEHPRETAFLAQCENSPYHQEAETIDDNFTLLFEMIRADIDAGRIRPLPFEVFYDLSIGVALSLAKRQISQGMHFDTPLLEAVAEACWRAVQT